MKHSHVRHNRMLLRVLGSLALAVGIAGSLHLIASHREAPLLMSLARTADASPTPQSDWHPAELAIVEQAPLATEEVGDRTNVVEGDEIHWFNGRPVRRAGTMPMLVTAYSPDERSCGASADGITASGYSVWTNGGKLVAADTKLLPFGSLVSVPGYGSDDGEIVPVLDRGGKIKGQRLDVLYATHERARRWGAQRLEVTIWEYADGKPVGFRTQH